MPRLPSNLVPYYRTREYDQTTIPAALKLCHTITKPGVWARVRVRVGRIRYVTLDDGVDYVLDPEHDGVIPPGVPHKLVIEQPVRLHLDFLRPPTPTEVLHA